MRDRLRLLVPLLIGGGLLLFLLDLLILAYRALGLDKTTAIYFALLTLVAASAAVTHRQLHKADPGE